jgi:peroxiredoxin
MPHPISEAPALLLAAAVLTGCGRSSSASDPSPSASASASGSSTSASAGKQTSMKEFAATPAPRLGTLPPNIGVPVGQPAPDVTAPDAKGRDVRLGDLIKKGPILVMFYRGGWCPYCNFEIHELSQAYPEYQKRGVTPVAISVDKQDEAAKTEATYTIPFPILSDPDLAAHKAFQVLHQADDAEVAKLKSFGLDIEESSGRTHHTFAIPALFLIDKGGVVRWAHADPDYKVRPRTSQILAAIDAAGLGPR